ncbi:guanine nucleotide-binding protein G(I)/G(S)/G(O) subunit gamma-7-like [Mya arenaria]|uniref:guanine nucleotide-binding protein G(I)/G(S)/G(O) subunit gamma-7-like n=1 Tax=Mya arenaria TaxID=6604 RepID=UPI0022DF6754|nr:guanine nucleotide-binding protein G(I)/G(S)/G(O) subunit gamma-7-like [Mya arenaria]
MSSQVQNLQKQLLQLRQEANVHRIPVSEAIGEIMRYTSQHASDDALVVGVPQSENPFKDAKGCLIL